jgi:hypothetical protein
VVCHHFSAFGAFLHQFVHGDTLRIPPLAIAMIVLGGTETIAQTVFFLFARHISW